MEDSCCFICRSPLADKTEPFINGEEQAKLENQVQVIFIITKLMDIPKQDCIHFLSSNGNPSGWIIYCKDCALFIRKSRKTYDKLMSLQKSFSLVKTQLKNYIKVAYEDVEVTTENYVNSKTNKHIPEYLLHLYLSQKEEECSFLDVPIDYNEDVMKIEADEAPAESDFCENDDENATTPSAEFDNGFEDEDSIGLNNIPDPEVNNADDNSSNDKSTEQDVLEENEDVLTTDSRFKYKCEYCQKGFTNKYSWDRHTRRFHTKEATHVCKKCGENFFDSGGVRLHFKLVHPEDKLERNVKCLKPKTSKPFRGVVCDICGKLCSGKSTYRIHMLSHTGERPYLCELCSEKFATVTLLTWHKHYAHYKELNLEPFKCNECGKCLRSPPALQYHMASLHSEKKFKCDICENGFVNEYKLSQHIKIVHEKQKMFECNVCGEKLLRRIQIEEHRQKHSGIRDYICEICKGGFTDKHSLRRHMKYHSEDFLHKRKSRLTSKISKC